MSLPFELNQLISSEQQKTTLWMGELESWMDEQYIQQLWFNLNEKVMVKVIRDKTTGISAGYAFVDFGNAASARRAMGSFNGVLMPNSLKPFKLNWASGGGLIDRREDRQPEYSIFVGDLSAEITEIDLFVVFQSHYLSCKSAKIMTDPRTGMTRGYGFVRFAEQLDQQRALVEMQGFFIGSRPIRVSVATPKSRTQQQQQQQHSAISTPSSSSLLTSPNKSPLIQSPPLLASPPQQHLLNDANNTTVFVGGLSAPIREEELRQYFSHFGEIVYVKIPPGKGCGFVQYVSRQSAELAIQQMNGYQIGNSRIRLSWGRSQNEKGGSTSMMVGMTSPVLSALSSNNNSMTALSQQQTPLNVLYHQQQQQPQQQHATYAAPAIYPSFTSTLNNNHLTHLQQQQLLQQQYGHHQQQHFVSSTTPNNNLRDMYTMQQQQPSFHNTADFKFLDTPTDTMFDSTSEDFFSRSLMDVAQPVSAAATSNAAAVVNEGRKPSLDWRLNQIYAQ